MMYTRTLYSMLLFCWAVFSSKHFCNEWWENNCTRCSIWKCAHLERRILKTSDIFFSPSYLFTQKKYIKLKKKFCRSFNKSILESYKLSTFVMEHPVYPQTLHYTIEKTMSKNKSVTNDFSNDSIVWDPQHDWILQFDRILKGLNYWIFVMCTDTGFMSVQNATSFWVHADSIFKKYASHAILFAIRHFFFIFWALTQIA